MQRYYGKSMADYIVINTPTADDIDRGKTSPSACSRKDWERTSFTAIPQSDMLGFAGNISRIMTYLVVAIASISLFWWGHRHHEHHVGVGDRAHPGDRPAQGRWSQARHILSQFITKRW